MIITRPAEPRLGWAVLSALRQEGPSHEVLVVLDGQCAHNRMILSSFDDPRLRVFEHVQPLGRGAARAHALQEARGAWICNVDADDWLYSDKQAVQWAYLQEEPTLDLIGTGIVVADRAGNAQGVRGTFAMGDGLAHGVLPALHTPTIMMRADMARRISFDPAWRAGEDRDFLYRMLPRCRWATRPMAGYVYHEYAGHSLRRCLSSYGRRVVTDVRYRGRAVLAQSVATHGVKAVAATLAFACGQGDWLVRRRSVAPTRAQRGRYAEERAALEDAMRTHLQT